VSDLKKHLYAVMYPNHALVASQLEPAEFGRYYSVGTARYYSGKMIFIEIDLEFRNDYFEIDKFLELTVPHPDGSPKQTKFISSYRVLEHLDLGSMQSLYAVTVSGETLEIKAQNYETVNDSQRIRIVQELNPIQLLVASTFDHRTLAKHLTSPGNPKGCPKLFFTQIDLDVDSFEKAWRENPFVSSPIPGIHPQKLLEATRDLAADSVPRTKSIGIQSVFGQVSYQQMSHGFFLASGEDLRFYPMPDEDTLRRDHYTWHKSMA